MKLKIIHCPAASLLALILLGPAMAESRAGQTASVTGTVTDRQGSPLAGALVEFRRTRPEVRIAVMTNRTGQFTAHLPPATYQVGAEARRYGKRQLEERLELASGDQRRLRLELELLQDPLALEAQINGAEFLSALPTHERRELVHRCVGCHSLGVVGGQRRSEEAWLSTVRRMSGQHPTGKGALKVRVPWENASWDETAPKLAKFVGPNSGHLDYKTFPIANDADDLSRVVIKEFQLARPEIYTHDVAADPFQDRVWYGDQAADKIHAVGRFGWYDPGTGKSKEYEVPQCKGFTRAVTQRQPRRVWVGCDNALAYWDAESDDVTVFPIDLGGSHLHGLVLDADGNVWMPLNNKTVNYNDDEFDHLAKFDARTRQLTKYRIPTPLAGAYEAQVDSKGNVWFTEIIADKIGKFDPRTETFTEYPIPSEDGAPRRFGIDSRDNIWFVEFIANKLAKLDSGTGTITEYEVPTPLSFPYGCSVDRDDMVWFTEIFGNRIGRFDPRTETFREYPIPSALSGIKKLDFTYLEDKLVIWGGYRVGATVVRYEFPLP